MRIAPSLLLLTASLLLNGLADVPKAIAQTPIQSATESVFTEAHLERLYFEELDRQSREFVKDLKTRLPQNEHQALDGLYSRLKRELRLRLRQVGFFKQSFMRIGMATVYIPAAVEATTSFIFGPILAALGFPYIGGLIAGVPTSPIAFAGTAFYLSQKERWRLQRELASDLNAVDQSLAKLDAFKNDLLGFDSRHRIQSSMLSIAENELKQNLPVEIVKQIDARRARTKGTLSIADLESIIASHGSPGNRFLKEVYLDKAYPDIYASKLLYYVTQEPDLIDLTSQHIRKGLDLSEDQVEIRSLLREIDNGKKEITFMQDELLKRRAELKKLIRDGASKEQVKKFREGSDLLGDLLVERNVKVRHLEYAFLIDLKRPDLSVKDAVENARKGWGVLTRELVSDQQSLLQANRIYRDISTRNSPMPGELGSICNGPFSLIHRPPF